LWFDLAGHLARIVRVAMQERHAFGGGVATPLAMTPVVLVGELAAGAVPHLLGTPERASFLTVCSQPCLSRLAPDGERVGEVLDLNKLPQKRASRVAVPTAKQTDRATSKFSADLGNRGDANGAILSKPKRRLARDTIAADERTGNPKGEADLSKSAGDRVARRDAARDRRLVLDEIAQELTNLVVAGIVAHNRCGLLRHSPRLDQPDGP